MHVKSMNDRCASNVFTVVLVRHYPSDQRGVRGRRVKIVAAIPSKIGIEVGETIGNFKTAGLNLVYLGKVYEEMIRIRPIYL